MLCVVSACAVLILLCSGILNSTLPKFEYDKLVQSLDEAGISGHRIHWYDGAVRINDPRFDDQCLKAIAGQLEELDGLVYLDFSRSSVSDLLSVIDLSKCNSLLMVRVDQTSVTREAVTEMRSRYPDIEIVGEDN